MTAKKFLGTTVLVVAAVSTGLALSRKPWDIYQKQKQAAVEQRQEMVESEARRAELLRQEAEVRSSVGRERLARKAGFVKPGEEPASE
ncbi:MAG TPA: hypothetical protein VGE01_07770 [Fimbriimonas sp.]